MYSLNISKKSQKFIDKQDRITRKRIEDHLTKLAENPFNKKELDIIPITGKKNMFRLKFSGIRVVYTIENDKLVILVLKIDNRGQVYKRL